MNHQQYPMLAIGPEPALVFTNQFQAVSQGLVLALA